MTLKALHIDFGDYLLKCLRLYGIPEYECEDVRQDLYLKLLENHTDLSCITQPKGFCSCIARNAAINRSLKIKRTPIMESITSTDKENHDIDCPELDTLTVAEWEILISNPNTDRIAQALELAQVYECEPGVTAYEVIAHLLCDLTMTQIASKYGLNKSTISRWVRDWRTWINNELTK